MEFELSPERLAFQREVAAFLAAELPPGRFYEESRQSPAQQVELDRFLKRLAERRWLALSWPVEYGGAGRDLIDHAIFNEQMGYYRAPNEALVPVTIIGPAILQFGTEAQKREHLPRITRGEGVYWQLFTEPNAGSDLAALETRALRDGDDFLVNGQKIFVGDGREPDYFYLAARTDPTAPKHRGISIFLVPARLPGITVTKLDPVAGWAKNQVFFDDVRVPASALMGQLNQGWSHMRETLAVERSGIATNGEARRMVEDLIAYCHELTRDGQPLVSHEWAQNLLADLLIEVEAWRWLCWRVVHLQATGAPIVAEASVVAIHRKAFFPLLQNAIYRLVGSYALLQRTAVGALGEGECEFWQREALHTHSAGTPEIQRNIVAVRGLGLPR
ncbi:MAG: acyl-CoA dehydrogenase family protein [Chloroflexi bacterium]|nr:acyl-CoA dehydrogenase family protein [Chloroflexota bacterium]GIW11046.1 MAG: acyl-CoA dehydrogenase [Dehalococcoidia bacterium]